jgi:hypothetical protein
VVLVLVNCTADARRAQIVVNGATVAGAGTGEQSTPSTYWSPLAELPTNNSRIELILPGASVTSVAFPLLSATPGPAAISFSDAVSGNGRHDGHPMIDPGELSRKIM